jgi:hypothetical protein
MNHFFEISFLSIKESLNHPLRQTKVAGISKITNSILIFYIDDASKPIFFTFKISIDSSFHPDKVVCFRLFSTRKNGSILGSCSYLFESCRHIWDS